MVNYHVRSKRLRCRQTPYYGVCVIYDMWVTLGTAISRDGAMKLAVKLAQEKVCSATACQSYVVKRYDPNQVTMEELMWIYSINTQQNTVTNLCR